MPIIQIPIILVIFVYCLFWLSLVMKSNENRAKLKTEDYLNLEREANFSLKKEISKDLFVEPEMESLPIREYADLEKFKYVIRAQQAVIRRKEHKMIKFKKAMSNRELKVAFGYSNLETITAYEENFVKYVFTLCSWAESLMEAGENCDAEVILKKAIYLGAEQSKPYLLLMDIYCKENNKDALVEFKEAFEKEYGLEMDSILKSKIEKGFAAALGETWEAKTI